MRRYADAGALLDDAKRYGASKVFDDDPNFTEGHAEVLRRMLRGAKVVRINRDTADVLREARPPAYASRQAVHAVFPTVFAEIDGGVEVRVESRICNAHSILVFAADVQDRDGLLAFGVWGIGESEGHPIGVLSIPHFLDDNGPRHDESREWDDLAALGRAVLDFLASPSVRIVPQDVTRINRSRRKKNKPPIREFSVVEWSTESRTTEATGTGYRHTVRYDVRGNWATFTRGPLTGRRVWRRPHQRGLANLAYKNTSYTVGGR